MSISEVMIMLNKQKEAREQARRKEAQDRADKDAQLRKTIQANVDEIRKTNRKRLSETNSIPEAMITGLLGGMTEGVEQVKADKEYQRSKYDADLDIAEQYFSQMNANASKIRQGQEQMQSHMEWLERNHDMLKDLAGKLRNMTPEQGVKALEPIFADYDKAVGGRREVVDFNPMNGNVLLRTTSGDLSAGSIYEDFPEIKQSVIYDSAMKNSGYSDEQILNEARKEEQAVINRQNEIIAEKQRHNRFMENLAQQKYIAEASADVNSPFAEAPYLKQVYAEQQKQSGKRIPEIKDRIMQIDDGLSANDLFLNNLAQLNAKRDEFERTHPGWLAKNGTKIGMAVKKWIAEGSPTAEKASKLLGMSDEEVKFIQDNFNLIKNRLTGFYAKYANDVMGTGVRSDKDMEYFQENVIPSFFTPGEGFKNQLSYYIADANHFRSLGNQKKQLLQEEENDYFIAPEEFVRRHK